MIDKLNWYFDSSILEAEDPIIAQRQMIGFERDKRRQLRKELRATCVSAKAPPVPASIGKALYQLVNSVFSGTVIFFTPVKKNSMCTYYGHVIASNWSGHLPKCTDCGVSITDPRTLRSSDARAIA